MTEPGRATRAWWVALFGIGFLGRVLAALMPASFVEKYVADDGLYYLQIASNVAHGHGSTFDQINPTNGYHPLWLAMLTPIGLLEHGVGALRLSILLAALVNVAAFFVLVLALRRHLVDVAVILGVAVWWLNPIAVSSSYSGMESAVVALTIAVCIALALRPLSWRTALGFGAACGLLVLSRTDAGFAVVALFGWYGWRHRDQWRRVIAAVGAAGVVVAPWFAWNLARFGSVFQASAYPAAAVQWARVRIGVHDASSSALVGRGVANATSYVSDQWLGQLGGSRTVVVVVLVLLPAGWLATRPWPAPASTVASLGLCLVAAGTALAAFHAGVRLSSRVYYFTWVQVAVGVLVAGAVAGVLAKHLEWSRVVRIATVVVMVWWGGAIVRELAEPPYGWQPSLRAAAEWIDEHTPKGSTVVSFNAGYVGYFSDRHVINVDGVVNNAAADAIREHRLAEYLCSTGARWYADFDPAARTDWAPVFGDDADRLHFTPREVVAGDDATGFASSSGVSIMEFSCS